MSNDLPKELEKYCKYLQKKLNKENDEYLKSEIDEKLGEANKVLNLIQELDLYDRIYSNLKILAASRISKEAKDKIKTSLLEDLKKYETKEDEKFLTNFHYGPKGVSSIDELIQTISSIICYLENCFTTPEPGFDYYPNHTRANEVEEYRAELKRIKAYKDTHISNREKQEDLDMLSSSETSTDYKESIIEKYMFPIRVKKSSVFDELSIELGKLKTMVMTEKKYDKLPIEETLSYIKRRKEISLRLDRNREMAMLMSRTKNHEVQSIDNNLTDNPKEIDKNQKRIDKKA